MSVEERGLDSKAVCKGVRNMATDGGLTESGEVQELQRIPHAKAQWLCRKHKVRSGEHVQFSDDRLYGNMV